MSENSREVRALTPQRLGEDITSSRWIWN